MGTNLVTIFLCVREHANGEVEDCAQAWSLVLVCVNKQTISMVADTSFAAKDVNK